MNLVFRISTRIRAAAPIPRGFLPIPGLEHLGLIYEQKVVSNPEEFNTILATITDRRFAARGCEFQPYALTAEEQAIAENGIQILTERREADELRQAQEAAAAAAALAAEAADSESAPEESEPETPEGSEPESSEGNKPEEQEQESSEPEGDADKGEGEAEADVPGEPEQPEQPEQPEPPEQPEQPEQPTDPAPGKFRLDGKAIFMGEERVAGLYGENNQLRVLSQFSDLRQEIEAWLTPSPL